MHFKNLFHVLKITCMGQSFHHPYSHGTTYRGYKGRQTAISAGYRKQTLPEAVHFPDTSLDFPVMYSGSSCALPCVAI